jgi:hypothetical protein
MELRLLPLAVLLIFGAVATAKFVLTPQEKKALAEFRPLVENILTHDYQRIDSYLVRWLQARKLHVQDAVDMLTAAQKWRKENKIDSILDEEFPEFFNLIFSDDGVDYEGRTVFTSSIGDFDIRKIAITGQGDRYLRFSLYGLEKAVSRAATAVLKSNGTLTDSRLVGVTDLQGFSLRKHACLTCIPLYIKSTRETEDNYPGITGFGVYINTPRRALPVFDVLLPFASPETRNALKIFGTNRTEWTAYIRTIIPPDQLTYQFGGTKKLPEASRTKDKKV